MCGIVGFFQTEALPPGAAERVKAMAVRLTHRGPDAEGIWLDETAGIALGHRRLSILDLSPLGGQPMASAGGRLQISYNGEIYNFAELRAELEKKGHRFRGGSDTEVVLAACLEWGVEGALPRFNGMFALALWDRETRKLTLARDRFGEKPLYYGWLEGALVFASELKAFAGFTAQLPPLSREGMVLFFSPQLHSLPALHLPGDREASSRELRSVRPFASQATGPTRVLVASKPSALAALHRDGRGGRAGIVASTRRRGGAA